GIVPSLGSALEWLWHKLKSRAAAPGKTKQRSTAAPAVSASNPTTTGLSSTAQTASTINEQTA
ncbi:MAG: hypothetical protein Q8Q74_15110, partial [Polaromonas sp.]|nr:hypothetical protein [Polaromonas sp.]